MLRLLALTPLAALTLAFCGCATKTSRVEGHTVALTLSEYRILPESISAPAGTLVVVAHNKGILTHNVTMERAASASETTPVILASTGTILPGASRSFTISLRLPGRYTLLSTITNQADLGMTGTLTIR